MALITSAIFVQTVFNVTDSIVLHFLTVFLLEGSLTGLNLIIIEISC